MAIRRLRRDGNSLVVTIPPEEAGKAHLVEGSYVEVEADEAGSLHIHPVHTRQTRPDFIAIGKKVIEENRSLLERLAAYDPEIEP
jgi:antitoxin component of MazEF toxin-antitoxin module